jgi:hypothetical protein
MSDVPCAIVVGVGIAGLAACGGRVSADVTEISEPLATASRTSGLQADGPFVVNVAQLTARASAAAGTATSLHIVPPHATAALPPGAPNPGALRAAGTAPRATGAAPIIEFEGQGQTGWVPPDTNGAVSAQFVVTTVNNQLTIRDRSGTLLSNVDLNVFWSRLPTTTNSFDTRSRFDPYGQRFIVSSGGSLGDTPNAGILVGVSQTSDPTGNWNVFRAKVDPAGLIGIDYPTLGFNKKWVVVSANIANRMWIFDKAGLYAGRGNFTVLPSPGLTTQPAETYDAALDDLFLLQLDTHSSTALYRLTGPVGSEQVQLVASVSAPASWNDPPAAPQLGSTQTIPTGFPWMMDCVYRAGSIWGTHEVQPVTGPVRSAVQWWRLSPQGQLQDFGRIDDPSGTVYYGMASVGVNKNSDALIGYTRFSADSEPSAGYAFRGSTDPAGTFRPGTVYQNGTGPYTANRWGDYSHTLVDPSDDLTFWTVQETSNGSPGWDTWWAEVQPESASVQVLLKSGNVTAITPSPHPQIQVVNTGSSPLALNTTSIRYWFNCDCTPGTSLQSAVDWAGILPPGQAITSVVATSLQPTTLGGQTHSLLIQFSGGLVLNPGQTVQVEARFNKADWSNMDQSNDWSFAPFANYAAWNKVTVYENGALIAGQEP